MTEAVLVALIGGGVGSVIASGIFSIIMWKLNQVSKSRDRDCDIVDGIKILLYDRIKCLGRKYIAEGKITAEDLEDLMEMHAIYHTQLGGNGFLDNLMTQVKKIPICS